MQPREDEDLAARALGSGLGEREDVAKLRPCVEVTRWGGVRELRVAARHNKSDHLHSFGVGLGLGRRRVHCRGHENVALDVVALLQGDAVLLDVDALAEVAEIPFVLPLSVQHVIGEADGHAQGAFELDEHGREVAPRLRAACGVLEGFQERREVLLVFEVALEGVELATTPRGRLRGALGAGSTLFLLCCALDLFFVLDLCTGLLRSSGLPRMVGVVGDGEVVVFDARRIFDCPESFVA